MHAVQGEEASLGAAVRPRGEELRVEGRIQGSSGAGMGRASTMQVGLRGRGLAAGGNTVEQPARVQQ